MGPLAMDQGEELLASLPETVDNARAELLKDPTLTIGAVEIDTQALNDRIDEAIQNARRRLEYPCGTAGVPHGGNSYSDPRLFSRHLLFSFAWG